jgi:hypothetical protein
MSLPAQQRALCRDDTNDESRGRIRTNPDFLRGNGDNHPFTMTTNPAVK